MKKNALFVVLPALLLAGCGAPSVESLVKDPEKLGKVLGQCMLLQAQGQNTNTEECNNAVKAQQIMAENMMKGLRGR